MLLTRNVRNADGSEQSFVDVLLQSVKVLAVDQVADESKENPTVVKAVTVEVDTKDAQKLTLAAGAGQLSLALRQAASSEGEMTERVTLADLAGETPVEVASAEAGSCASVEAERSVRRRAQRHRSDIQTLGAGRRQAAAQQQRGLPKCQEVVKEVVKYVAPEPPATASVSVIRANERQVYDVPRSRRRQKSPSAFG